MGDATTGDITFSSVTSSDYTALDSTNPDAADSDVTGFIDESLPRELPEPTPGYTHTASAGRGANPPKPPRVGLLDSSPSHVTPAHAHEHASPNNSHLNLTAEEQKLQDKISNMAASPAEQYRLTFPGGDSVCEETQDYGGETYVRHSPDESAHQVGYDPVLGHYSHGGRGYPHGSFPSPSALSPGGADDLPEVHAGYRNVGGESDDKWKYPVDGPTQHHCDEPHGVHNGNTNSLPPAPPTSSRPNSATTQLDNADTMTTTARHNGLNNDASAAAQQQRLLLNDVECMNEQNCLVEEGEKARLLPGDRGDGPDLRGGGAQPRDPAHTAHTSATALLTPQPGVTESLV